MPKINARTLRAYITRQFRKLGSKLKHNATTDDVCEDATTPEPPLPPLTPEEAASHNACQPLLKLSPEVLGQILMHLRTLYPFSASYTTEGSSRAGVDLGWVHITHVCQQLRYVALGYSELWSKLVCNPGNARWFAEWLGRSGSVPLSLVLHPLPQGDDSNIERYHEHLEICGMLVGTPEVLSRLRSVRGDFTRGTLDVLRALFTRPAPLLEELDVGVLDTPNCYYVIPTPWFAADAPPRLTRLTLRDFYLPWSTFNLHTLTHLEVRRTVHRPRITDPPVVEHVELAWDVLPASERSTQLEAAFPPSTDDFHKCLLSLPLLESLTLQNTLPELPLTSTSTDAPKLPLPHLRKLAISHSDSTLVLSFLHALDTPHLAHLTIDINAEPHLAQYASLIAYAASYVHHFGLPIGALGIEMEDLRSTVRVALPQDPTYTSEPTFTEVLVMSSSVEDTLMRDHALQLEEPLLALLRALPLSSLHSLSLNGAYDHKTMYRTMAARTYMSLSLWRPIFAMCASARVVQAANMGVMPLVPLLSAYRSVCGMVSWVKELDEEEEEREPVFPRLRELWLLQSNGDSWCAGYVFEMLTSEWGVQWGVRTEGWEGSRESVESVRSERRPYGPDWEEHKKHAKRAKSYKFVRLLKDCLLLHKNYYHPHPSHDNNINGRPTLEYLRVDIGYEEEDRTVVEYAGLLRGVAEEVVVVKVDEEGVPAMSVTARMKRR